MSALVQEILYLHPLPALSDNLNAAGIRSGRSFLETFNAKPTPFGDQFVLPSQIVEMG